MINPDSSKSCSCIPSSVPKNLAITCPLLRYATEEGATAHLITLLNRPPSRRVHSGVVDMMVVSPPAVSFCPT